MNKFSKIKYAGVTAAALLAVSPVASTVFSQNSVSAAITSDQSSEATKSMNALPNSVDVTTSTDLLNDMGTFLGATNNTFNTAFTNNSNKFAQAIRNTNWTANTTNDSGSVQYTVTQANGWSAADTKASINNYATSTTPYPVVFTVKAVDTSNGNAVVATKNITVNFKGSAATTKMTANFANATAKVGDSINPFGIGYNAIGALSLTDANGNAVKANAVSALLTDNGTTAPDSNNKFSAYGTAKQQLTFTIPASKNSSNEYVTPVFSDDSKIKSNTVNQTTGLATITIERDVLVYNGNQNYQPYFSVKNSAGNQVSVANNATPAIATTNGLIDGSSLNLATLTNNINAQIKFNYNNEQGTTATATTQDVKNAVVAAGGSVDSSNNISNLSGIYYLNLTMYSPINNKAASVKLPVTFSAQGTTSVSAPVFEGTGNATIIQGQNFDAYKGVKAFDNGQTSKDSDNKDYHSAPQIMSGYWSVQNPVNTNVPGDYTVVYSVVNSQGLTTTVNRTVTVLPVNGLGKDQVVNFVPGYGVMVWSATDNAVNATSDFVQHGTTVKTFDTKTVDGVSYTRINSANSNQWVQSKYFDANANNAPQTNNNDNNTNTSSNQETPFEGTLTIKYVPGYRVFLRDGQANMQQQSVGDGEAYKVWAKKTVGNHTYYRIGTDAQWIEDTYAQF